MKTIFAKIAGAIAFIIGMMAVFAGGKVLLGIMPDYYVINWVPVYNYTIGVITVLFTAALIWRNSRFALPAALATLGVHVLVLVILKTAFNETVAPDSIQAMTVRIITWLVILGLLFLQARRSPVRNPQTA